MKTGKNNFLLAGALILALVCIDQVAKFFVRVLIPPLQPISIFGQVQFVNITNTGTLFGLLKGSSSYLVALAVVAIPMLAFYCRKLKGIQRAAAVMIISGMAGNTIDRILRGYVTDFIYVRPWPAFNLADVFLTVGAAVMAVAVFAKKKRK